MKETGHFGALFAKALVAQKALIDELAANQAFIKQLVVQRLKIDSDRTSDKDFEAWFDETNGLKIKNKGEEIFSVKTNGDAVFSGEIKCNGFQVLNTTTTNKKLLFSWKKEDTGHDVYKKIHNLSSLDFVRFDIQKHIFYGDGWYGDYSIRCIITYGKNNFVFDGGRGGKHTSCRAVLISNSGEKVAQISSSHSSVNLYLKHIEPYITDKNNENWGVGESLFAWVPSLYDFEFYTYNQNQKVVIPNIQFGKAAEKNVLYRDENGFIKIS